MPRYSNSKVTLHLIRMCGKNFFFMLEQYKKLVFSLFCFRSNTVGSVWLARCRRKLWFFKRLYISNLSIFWHAFFILSSMEPIYTDNIFSYICQLFFCNMNFKWGTFLTSNFCYFSWIKVCKCKDNFLENPSIERFLL